MHLIFRKILSNLDDFQTFLENDFKKFEVFRTLIAAQSPCIHNTAFCIQNTEQWLRGGYFLLKKKIKFGFNIKTFSFKS